MATCDDCGKSHKRKRFCSNRCKDRWHNKRNPRGIAVRARGQAKEAEDDRIHDCGLDAVEDGWDGHKNAF